MAALESIGSLQQELDGVTFQLLEFTPKELMEILFDKAREMASSEIISKSTKVGDAIHHFALRDMDGKLIRTSSLLSKGPLVISFFRGNWCTYCNLTLQALEKAMPNIKAKGANLIAISPQTEEHTLQAYKDFKYHFPILSDPGNEIAKQFNIAYVLDKTVQKIYHNFDIDIAAANGDESFVLPLAATFVVDQNRSVVYSFVDSNPAARAEPEDIIEAIPTSKSKCGVLFRRNGFMPKFRSLLTGTGRSAK